jgi:hypothetical protein
MKESAIARPEAIKGATLLLLHSLNSSNSVNFDHTYF